MATDPFALTEGGGIDDIEATITDAIFMLNDKFVDDDGNPLCELVLTIDPEDGEHDEFTWTYGFGRSKDHTWEPINGGASARYADDPDNESPMFPLRGPRIGRLVSAIRNLCPEVLIERYADGEGVGATDAAMFVGLRFHWKMLNEPKNVRQEDGSWRPSKTETTAILLPEDFIEVRDGGKKPAKKAAAKPKAAAKEEESTDEPVFSTELLAGATEAFDACEGFDDWLQAVIELDGIEPHLAWVKAPSGGLWDQLCAAAAAG